MNLLHNASLKLAKERKSFLSILSPDAVLADGGFKTITLAINQGYLAVCCIAPCANKTESLPELQKFKINDQFNIKTSELAKIWFDHKNKLATSHFVHKKINILISPSYFYFPVNRYCIIARQFHLHPIIINPENSPETIEGTFDLFFVEKSINDYSKVKVITDSKTLNYLEFSKNYMLSKGLNSKALTRCMPQFVQESTSVYNIKNIWHNIYYHTSNKKISKRTELFADNFIKDVLSQSISNKEYRVIYPRASVKIMDVISLLGSYLNRKLKYWFNLNNIEYKRLAVHIFKIVKNIQFYLLSVFNHIRASKINSEQYDAVINVSNTQKLSFSHPDVIYSKKQILILYHSTADLMRFLQQSKNKINLINKKIKFQKISTV